MTRTSTLTACARPESGSRNEVLQIGFRLARQLGHEHVHPVDQQMPLGNDSLRAFRERGGRTIHTMDYSRLIPPRLLIDEDSLLRLSVWVSIHAGRTRRRRCARIFAPSSPATNGSSS